MVMRQGVTDNKFFNKWGKYKQVAMFRRTSDGQLWIYATTHRTNLQLEVLCAHYSTGQERNIKGENYEVAETDPQDPYWRSVKGCD